MNIDAYWHKDGEWIGIVLMLVFNTSCGNGGIVAFYDQQAVCYLKIQIMQLLTNESISTIVLFAVSYCLQTALYCFFVLFSVCIAAYCVFFFVYCFRFCLYDCIFCYLCLFLVIA